MMCERCQEHQGGFLLRFVVPGESQPHDTLLCEECLKKEVGTGQLIGVIGSDPVVAPKIFTKDREEEIRQLMEMRCEKCNATLGEVSMRRKFGCENCYTVFGDLLATADARIARENDEDPVSEDDPESFKKQVQQNVEEKEKRRHLDRLEKQMETSVKMENYERCSVLKEQIEALKKELGIQQDSTEEEKGDD